MKIGLVVPVLNNFDQAIDLIYSAKTRYELKIYIQPQYLYQIPLAAAWNNGIRSAIKDQCDYVIVSNDDVIFAPHTIDSLVEQYQRKSVAIMFPLDVKDDLMDDYNILFVDKSQTFNTKVIEDQSYSCFMVDAGFFEKCGTFDENFDPAWWEDTDMKYRIHLLGLDTLQTSIPYVHRRHQSTQKLSIPINSLKSQQYYERKWGSCNRELNELYSVPYNDSNLTPKDWRK